MWLIRQKFYILEKIILFEHLKNSEIILPYDTVSEFHWEILADEYGEEMFTNHLDKIYKTKNLKDISLNYSDNAIEQFYSLSGNFGKKELEQIRFENLKNDEFVLAKQPDEFSIEEMKEILKK